MPEKSAKLSKAATTLLELVPLDGTFIGNATLQRRSRLGDKYWKIRSELVDAGSLTRGKGRGGSVARQASETAIESGKKPKGFVKRESELYEPLRAWLTEEWGGEVETGDFFEALVTATPKNKKMGGGKWSRPDVTVVEVNSYDYLPQPVLEVTTFEVKKFPDAENIRSVYETAAHSRWAHFSYLVAEVPNPDYEFPRRFVSELERFHLGLILMWKEKSKWEFSHEEWETDRLTPDPQELNRLLEEFFQSSKKLKSFKQALGKG